MNDDSEEKVIWKKAVAIAKAAAIEMPEEDFSPCLFNELPAAVYGNLFEHDVYVVLGTPESLTWRINPLDDYELAKALKVYRLDAFPQDDQ